MGVSSAVSAGASLPCGWPLRDLEGLTPELIAKLAELGIILPTPAAPVANYVPFVRTGDLVVISAPRDGLPNPNEQLGGLSLRPLYGDVMTVKRPGSVVQRMRGETLSVTILEETQTVVATNPYGNLVSMWHLTEGTFIGKLELPGPRGVCQSLDQEWFLVSHVLGHSVALTAYSSATRKPTGWVLSPSFMSGSHVVSHDLST